jgi:hypothetical protein
MSEVINWATLAKTSVTSSHYIPVTSRLKFQLQSLFPSLATAGAGSESLFSSISNKNQLNFKGIKSGDTGLLTVATVSDNIVLTALEAGIDLSKCDNSTSNFLSTVALASNVSGILSVVNGGTGLNSVTKGSILYASAADTLAASSPMATNGQLLIGNATNGYPSVATLTAGTNMTVTNTAGAITLASSFSSAASAIDMNTYNINLDAAAGQSWVSGDGSNEGMTVDANGRVILQDGTHSTDSSTAQLSLQGTSSLAIEIGNDATYKAYSIGVRTAASGAGATLTMRGATGSSNNNGGGVLLAGGLGAGSGDGGPMNIYGGAGGSSGAGASLNLNTYSGSGTGSPLAAVTITNTQNVQIPNGYLQFSETPQTLTGPGAVDVTSAITWIVTTGADSLSLANGVEGQTKYIVMKTDGGNGTLTPTSFAQGTNIVFDAVGDSVCLMYTNAGWHIMGGQGYAVT